MNKFFKKFQIGFHVFDWEKENLNKNRTLNKDNKFYFGLEIGHTFEHENDKFFLFYS